MPEAEGQAATRLSIRAAAKVAGLSERTLRRYIASGKLSAVDDGHGARLVDTSELLRLGLLRRSPVTGEAVPTGPTTGELDNLRERAEAAEARCKDLETERDAWRGQAAAWQQQAEGLLRALPAATDSPQSDAQGPAPRRPWWRRADLKNSS